MVTVSNSSTKHFFNKPLVANYQGHYVSHSNMAVNGINQIKFSQPIFPNSLHLFCLLEWSEINIDIETMLRTLHLSIFSSHLSDVHRVVCFAENGSPSSGDKKSLVSIAQLDDGVRLLTNNIRSTLILKKTAKLKIDL